MKLPIIVAHRGLHDVHIENTLPALRAAWEAGITWCEIDVRGSREHQPFVLHDETLERTTRGRGPIDQAAAGTLRELDVPSLHEVIQAMPVDGRLLVEVKPGVSREVIRRTMEACDPQRCVVQSFDTWVLSEARTMGTRVPLQELVEDATTGRMLLSGLNCRHDTLFAGIVEDLHKRGVPVGAWTVNEDADIRRMIALGIDMIISDRPLRVRDICREIA